MDTNPSNIPRQGWRTIGIRIHKCPTNLPGTRQEEFFALKIIEDL